MSNVSGFEHKLIHYAKELWPYFAAFFSAFILIAVSAFKLMWYRLTNKYATKEQLKLCREDVRRADEKNLDIVFKEIRMLRSESESRHHEVMNQIIKVLGKK